MGARGLDRSVSVLLCVRAGGLPVWQVDVACAGAMAVVGCESRESAAAAGLSSGHDDGEQAGISLGSAPMVPMARSAA